MGMLLQRHYLAAEQAEAAKVEAQRAQVQAAHEREVRLAAEAAELARLEKATAPDPEPSKPGDVAPAAEAPKAEEPLGDDKQSKRSKK